MKFQKLSFKIQYFLFPFGEESPLNIYNEKTETAQFVEYVFSSYSSTVQDS